jgi:hypothetical protein
MKEAGKGIPLEQYFDDYMAVHAEYCHQIYVGAASKIHIVDQHVLQNVEKAYLTVEQHIQVHKYYYWNPQKHQLLFDTGLLERRARIHVAYKECYVDHRIREICVQVPN